MNSSYDCARPSKWKLHYLFWKGGDLTLSHNWLCSKITLEFSLKKYFWKPWGTIWDLKIETGSTVGKANALPSILSLELHLFF